MACIQDQTAPLRRVYVRDPRRDDLASWRAYGWLEPPDPFRAKQEHAAFRAELEMAGGEVVVGEAEVAGDPDAIYTYDPALAAMADGIRRVFMAHVTRYAENAPFVHEVADAFAAIQAGDVQWVRRPTTTPASPSGPAGSVASASSPGPAPFEPQWLQRGTCEGQPHE
jgi:hypothetical protein